MRFGPVTLDAAEGHVLGHNVAGPDGAWLLRKGRRLSAEDVSRLGALGRRRVYVAELEPGDVDENAAADRVARAAAGPGLRTTGAASGRANLVATRLGILRVDPARLRRLNLSDGITAATALAHSPVRDGQIVATVKILPFAVPEASVVMAEALLRDAGPLLCVDALSARTVGLVLTGSPASEARVRSGFEAPLRARVAALGSALGPVAFVPIDEATGEAPLAAAFAAQAAAGCAVVIVAGETAIVDRHDMAPRALEQAGGELVAFGAPVDPGNLLLLGRLGTTAVLGAPGCARSPRSNVVDLVLPRLLAGDRLTRDDVAAWGHGGLLEDVAERGAPRSEAP